MLLINVDISEIYKNKTKKKGFEKQKIEIKNY